MLKVQDTVRAVIDKVRFEKVVSMMRDARSASITTNNIPRMVELAATDYGMTKKESGGILDHLIHGGEFNLYGPCKCRYQSCARCGSYDRSTEMESIGYSVLNMSRMNWERLNNASAAA